MGEKRSLKSAAMDIMPVDLFRDAMTHLAPTGGWVHGLPMGGNTGV